VTFESASAALHELVASTAAASHCPTISWAVTCDGAIVASGGHGLLHDGTRPTTSTVYRIASMTKSFTAATVLALRDEGHVALDHRIADLAPELETIVGPTSDATPITVRHLLSMSAGMANDDPWADRHLDIDDAGLDAVLARGAWFAAPTGTAFEYSNLGFAMLGRIIRRVTGTSVQTHITERFLEPLGMQRTTWVQPNHDDWARPFEVLDDMATRDPLAPLGDGEIAAMGGLWSTTADICRWMSWLDEGTPARDGSDTGPLCRASRREMQKMQQYQGMKVLAERAAPTGYGFGLMIRDDDLLGWVVSHSGGLPGYGSNMRWLAGRRVGVVALGNVMYAPMSELTLRMLKVLHDHEGLPRATAAGSGAGAEAGIVVLDDLARRLVHLLGDWTDSAATDLFADNVGLDESYERRAARAAETVARLGTLRIGRISLSTAAAAEIHLADASGTTVIEFDLAPIMPARIQAYSIEHSSNADPTGQSGQS
jgi:CubicO group peptidase (beta-lactamase class C family)